MLALMKDMDPEEKTSGVTVAELLLLEESVSSWQYVGPAVEMVAYLVTAIMTVTAMRNGVITSGPQFVFWLVDSVCRALTFRTVANTYIEADLPKEGPSLEAGCISGGGDGGIIAALTGAWARGGEGRRGPRPAGSAFVCCNSSCSRHQFSFHGIVGGSISSICGES